MALTQNHRDQAVSRDEMDLLIQSVRRASRLIFAGLLALAVSILTFALTSAGAVDLLSDRRIHYALIGGIVLLYVYLQQK